MNTQQILNFIEATRISRKIHKTSFCASIGITTQYYYNLLAGKSSPNIEIVMQMLEYFDFSLFIGIKLD